MSAPSLAERIDESYRELTPQEQRGADFLRQHLVDLAVYNLTEVATLSGVSKATISRLYRRLGFDSAEDLRDHARALRASGTPVAGAVPASLEAHLDREQGNLRAALAEVDPRAAARVLSDARRVLVIGFRNSYPMALHLRQQLAQARDGVEVAPHPGQSVGEELASIDARDAVVLIGLRRRPELFGAVAAAVRGTGAAVILITDAGGRRHAAAGDLVVECSTDSVGAFDSYAAVASVISLIADAVLARREADGRRRVRMIDELYDRLDELEPR